MTAAQGTNTAAGELLNGFLARLEALEADKKAVGEDIKIVMAEAKGKGFATKFLRHLVKMRKLTPSERAEYQGERNMYEDAGGCGYNTSFAHSVALAGEDALVREKVIEALTPAVPPHGMGWLDVNMGGKHVRLQRDKSGKVEATEMEPATSEASTTQIKQPKPKAPIPDVDEDGAEDLGKQAAKEDLPVTSNPFPYGDPRQARFEKGWRKASGSDGMGPSED